MHTAKVPKQPMAPVFSIRTGIAKIVMVIMKNKTQMVSPRIESTHVSDACTNVMGPKEN